VAWGDNSQGQTNVPSTLSHVVAVATGGLHCLALKSDGSIAGWGYNAYGQTTLPAGPSNFVSIACGSTHSVALRNDGTVVAWGDNTYHQTNVPVALSNVVAIAAGMYDCLALKLDGTVVAWGNNCCGQTNVPAGLSNVVSIASGSAYNLALKRDGTIAGWGDNFYGQDNPPAGFSNVVALAGGAYDSEILLHAGLPAIIQQPLSRTVFSGSTVFIYSGAVGNLPLNLQWQFNGTNIAGATNSYLMFTNLQPSAAGSYTMVASNPDSGIAVSSNAVLSVLTSPPIILTQPSNTLVLSGGSATFAVSVTGPLPFSCQWQFNGTNIINATNATLTLTNLTWPNNGAYAVIVSNSYGSVTSSNAVLTLPRSLVVAWGNNGYGQTNVPSTLSNAVGIAAGYENSLALKTDGTVSGWGNNGWQQTAPPTGLSNVVAIATGGGSAYPFSLALKSDGTVAGWGSNAGKQSSPPTGLTNVVAIAAGQLHGLALRDDGRVTAWGGNSYGQTNVPTTLTNAVSISAGLNYCMALGNNGVLTAWGDNTYGQTNIPFGLTIVTAIASGWYHCLALRNDGSITAWGNNNYQQTNVPAGLSNVIAIAAGQYHSLAVKNDGTVVAWGQNTYRQTNVPAGLNHVVSVAGGADHSLALIQDGPPVIFTQPASQTNYAGFTAILSGNASGLQPLYFQWLFNGTNIIGATNATLILANAQPNMAGVYSFLCSNALATAASSNAVISVLTNSPFLTLQPTNQTGIAGSNVTFFVAVGAGPVPNLYQWRFNGTNITGATNAVLTLTNVQAANQGNYAAVVDNGFGTALSSNAYLTVIALDLPTALNTTGLTWTTSGSAVWFAQTNTSHDGLEAAQSGTVANGQSSALQTTVTGPGTLTFWWMCSPATAPYPNTLSFSSSQGNNSASVNSTSGWQQRTFYLGAGQQTLTWNYSRYSILSSQSTGWVDQVGFTPGGTPPTITSMSPNAYVRAKSNTVFAVSAYGTPPLAYQWQLNNINLSNKTNAFLSLTGVQLTNGGVYTVIITNGFGNVTSNATLWVGQFGLSASPADLFMSTNGFQLTLDGVLTTNPVVIFGSTDFVNWLPLFTNAATTGSVQFLDVTATNMPARFYRAQE
jgi:alpha-tubulin suppressor-like RCC1 family protein